MRAVKFLIPLAVAVVGLVLPGTASLAADPYPAPPPNLTVSPGTVFVGESVTAVGTNFGANDVVTIEVTYRATAAGQSHAMVPIAYQIPILLQQTVTADASGDFTTTVQLTQAGTATLTATGAPSGLSASASVLVLATGGSLPVTGSDVNFLNLALIGSALAAGGALLFVFARSRRRRAATPA